jgi:MFS family permease
MDKYNMKLDDAQIYIFMYLAAGAVGTFFGGPLADRFGRRNLILISMVGTVPFALALPFVNPFWAAVLLLIGGFVLLSSFSVTVIYAQMLYPGNIGLSRPYQPCWGLRSAHWLAISLTTLASRRPVAAASSHRLVCLPYYYL